MNHRLRIAAIVAGAFVGALLLKVLPPIIVLAGFVVGSFVVTRTLKTRMRHEAVVGEATTLGLRFEASDPFGLLGYPLSLFGRGVDGRIEAVRWGTWRGVEVKAFEFTFSPPVPAIERSRSGSPWPPYVRDRRDRAIGAAGPRGARPVRARPRHARADGRGGRHLRTRSDLLRRPMRRSGLRADPARGGGSTTSGPGS